MQKTLIRPVDTRGYNRHAPNGKVLMVINGSSPVAKAADTTHASRRLQARSGPARFAEKVLAYLIRVRRYEGDLELIISFSFFSATSTPADAANPEGEVPVAYEDDQDVCTRR